MSISSTGIALERHWFRVGCRMLDIGSFQRSANNEVKCGGPERSLGRISSMPPYRPGSTHQPHLALKLCGRTPERVIVWKGYHLLPRDLGLNMLSASGVFFTASYFFILYALSHSARMNAWSDNATVCNKAVLFRASTYLDSVAVGGPIQESPLRLPS